jgi:hypothetical protein
VEDGVVFFVAAIVGTRYAIVDGWGRAREAIGRRITGLRAVAILAIIAALVTRSMNDGVGVLVAGILGATDSVVGGRRGARHATKFRVAAFGAIAVEAIVTLHGDLAREADLVLTRISNGARVPIVARAVVCFVGASLQRIARVVGAQITVVTGQDDGSPTSLIDAGVALGACIVIVTGKIVGVEGASRQRRAAIVGARVPVLTG